MKVYNLKSGDLIELGNKTAIYICQVPHPIYPGMRLVIWQLDNGEFSFDALNPGQDVGDWVNNDQERLRRVFQTGS